MTTWTIPRIAVIPTNGRECVEQCLDAILPQVDRVILVETQKWDHDTSPTRDKVHYYWMHQPGVNISKWWAHGLAEAKYQVRRAPKWDVALINDDAIVPLGWFDAVASKMREMKAAAASSSPFVTMPVFYTKPGPVDLYQRMQGFAFILAGELEPKPDERFSWYCSDDHLDWQAREKGGVVVIPGFEVNHLYPNGQVTPQIQQQIAKDMANFVDVWGMRPW